MFYSICLPFIRYTLYHHIGMSFKQLLSGTAIVAAFVG